jgi:hypothetical protein
VEEWIKVGTPFHLPWANVTPIGIKYDAVPLVCVIQAPADELGGVPVVDGSTNQDLVAAPIVLLECARSNDEGHARIGAREKCAYLCDTG